MKHDAAIALVDQQFDEGPLDSERQQALRAHLRSCEPCREHYDRLAEVERALEAGAPAPRAQIGRLIALGTPTPAPVQRKWWHHRWVAGAAAMAASALLVVSVLGERTGGPTDELTARGGTTPTTTAWVRVFAGTQGNLHAVETGQTVLATDALAFAYTNLAESPHRYVVIVGRDAAGRVHWYHPGYAAGSTPKSVAVQKGVTDRELPALVRSEHATGALEICAMFTAAPLEVAPVDQALEAGEPWPSGARCITVTVTPP